MKVTFEVVGCNPNKEGNYVWKLLANEEREVFGVKKMVKRTFYIGNMPKEVEKGTKLIEDMAKFNVKEYDFALPDTGEVIQLSWLHAKL